MTTRDKVRVGGELLLAEVDEAGATCRMVREL